MKHEVGRYFWVPIQMHVGRDFDLESLFLIASSLLIEKPDWGRETNHSADAWNMKMYLEIWNLNYENVSVNEFILELTIIITWGKNAKSKAVVEDVDLSSCRQDFHHKLEFGNVE